MKNKTSNIIKVFQSINNSLRNLYINRKKAEEYTEIIEQGKETIICSTKDINLQNIKKELQFILVKISFYPINIIIALIPFILIIVLSPNRYDFVTAFYYFIGYIWIANDLKPFTLSIISLIALIPVPILLAFKIEFVAEAFASAFYTFLTISLIGIIIQQAKLALAKRNSRE